LILLAAIDGVVGVLAGAAATAVYTSLKSRAIVIPAEAWLGGIASAMLIGAFAGPDAGRSGSPSSTGGRSHSRK
jgi:putative ABC transport system permease protein